MLFAMKHNKNEQRRFQRTLSFIKKVEPNCKCILDLGVRNSLSFELEKRGYIVQNTLGEDLDLCPECIKNYDKPDVVTAFEILEHLVSPFDILKHLPSNKLIATVPLNLWFAKPYRNKSDKFDMHYHEFVDWQFDMLLEKAGWKIEYSEKWTAPICKIGLRPLLRLFYPRFYAVYATRKNLQ